MDPEGCFADLLKELAALGIEARRGEVLTPQYFVSHLVADRDGSLLTKEEYEKLQRERASGETESEFETVEAEPVGTDLTVMPPARAGSGRQSASGRHARLTHKKES